MAAGIAAAQHDEQIVEFYKLQAELIEATFEHAEGSPELAFTYLANYIAVRRRYVPGKQ